MRFKIDWASLIVGSKFIVFALFYFVFEGNFLSTSPRGGLYLEGRFNGGVFALPVWGAYIWRGLYMDGLISEFYVIHSYIFIFAFRYSSFVHSFLLILTSPCVFSLPFRLLTTPILHSRERRPEREVTTQMARLCRRLKSSVHGSGQIFEQRKA